MKSTRKLIAVLAGAVMAGTLGAKTLAAQNRDARWDARWDAWIGCWMPVAGQDGALREIGGAGSPRVCVAPAAGTSAVEVLTIASSGTVLDRTRIDADGAPHQVVRDGCTGTETARWAAHGTRVYVTTQFICAGGVQRRGTGVMSFNQQHEWLDVRGMSSGDVSGVAVARYAATDDTSGIPADVRTIVPARTAMTNAAALAASAPMTLADIADVGVVVDSGVASTWLMERTQGVKVTISGKQLEALADRGVPSAVIDVVVAIAYPRRFALTPGSRDTSYAPTDKRATRTSASTRCPVGFGYGWWPYYGMNDPFFGFGCGSYGYGSYGYRGYSPFGGYGYYNPYGGYYPGSQPIIVVTRPSNNGVNSPGHGRVVKGEGYVGSRTSTSSGGGATASTTSGGSASGSSSPAPSSGSTSSGGGETRTAVRKPPQ